MGNLIQKKIQAVLSCFAKMISNAMKYKEKTEKRGGKRKTTLHDDCNILRTFRKDPTKSAVQIKKELNLKISDMTVRRRLLKQNLAARSPRRKPLLTKKHKVNLTLNKLNHQVKYK